MDVTVFLILEFRSVCINPTMMQISISEFLEISPYAGNITKFRKIIPTTGVKDSSLEAT